MFLLQLWKEIKVFFTSKGNLLFMFVMPLLLITIFSYALRDYINADYGTFDGAKVYYCEENAGNARIKEFEMIRTKLTQALGVTFESVTGYEAACRAVEKCEAYGVIRINENGYAYFRSDFNEPEGGKLVRTLFAQMAGNVDDASNEEMVPQVNKIRLNVSKFDSKNYYTFAGLAFSILFMGLLVAFMVYDEKEFGTIERIRLSNAGVSSMVFSKVFTGILCGCVMIGTSYLYSRFVLKVDWGTKTTHILLILLCLCVFSATFGCVVGLAGKNKTVCQSGVMMFSMLCGYLGGSITPLYLLENVPVLNWIIKISPLYYTNRAVSSLYNGVVDEKTTYCIAVLLGLTVVLSLLGIKVGKKVTKKA
jgi:ABC-2 type transport system permease protein